MKQAYQDDLLAIARERQLLVSEFLRLTEIQAEHIEAGEFEPVLQLICRKQSIIEKVNCLDLDSRGLISGQEPQMMQVTSCTQAMLTRAGELENRNINAIQQNQARIFSELKMVQAKKATHAAYRGKNVALEGILVDKKQ